MFKKLTALVLASVMLLMPMTASAVTWSTIMNDLHSGNSSNDSINSYSYDDGETTVETYNDSYIKVKGGTIKDIAIQSNPNDASSTIYAFEDVTVVGDTLFIKADESFSYVSFDSASKVDVGKVSVQVSNGGSAGIDNAGELNADSIVITANHDSYFDIYNRDSGSIHAAGDIAVVTNDSNSYIGNSGTISTDGELYVSSNSDDRDSLYLWNKGTIEGDVQIWANNNAAAVIDNSDGKIDGDLYAGATGDSYLRFCNEEGEVDTLYLDRYDNATISTYWGDESAVANGTIDRAVVYVNTPDGSKPTSEQIQNVLSTIDLSNLADSVNTELWTYDDNGAWVARYAINENGEVTLLEYLNVTEEEEDDSEPSPEMIRHWMEEKRKAEAIGGVYGSPYWVKQLYLGYHSLNLRIFENGERQLFRQSLSWIVEERAKRLTLWVRDENPENLTMRFDEEVLDILDRAEFSTVTLQDGNHNLYMEYKVADLRAAYEKYGLSGTDLLVVGDMDTEVMKIGADGQLVPVEDEEAEAAEAEAAAEQETAVK